MTSRSVRIRTLGDSRHPRSRARVVLGRLPPRLPGTATVDSSHEAMGAMPAGGAGKAVVGRDVQSGRFS